MGFRVAAGAGAGASVGVGMPAANNGYNRSTDWPTVTGARPMSTNAIGTMNPTSWHPTVLWMFGFVVVELVLFHILSRFLNL